MSTETTGLIYLKPSLLELKRGQIEQSRRLILILMCLTDDVMG